MQENCSDTVPRSEEFLDALSSAESCLIIICGILCMIAVIILIDNIVFIWRKHTRLKSAVITSTWLVAMCPTLAVLALMAMIVPNAFLFRDVTVSVSQSVIMYKFVQLLNTYANNITGIREQILAEKIHFNVRPICCCLICLPTARPDRTNIRILKIMVLQYSVIMVVLTNLIMITWLDGKYIPGAWTATNLYPYLSIMRVTSVLTAIYALNVLVTLCMKAMSSLYVKHKFNALSLCLVFFSIQGVIFEIMAANDVFNFRHCVSSRIIGNFYENVVFCMEMFLLTIFNLWSYRRPLGPPLNLTELEKPSLHEVTTNNILGHRTTEDRDNLSKHFHQTRINSSPFLTEFSLHTEQRSNSTVIGSNSETVTQIFGTIPASILVTASQSWSTNMNRDLEHIHLNNIGRTPYVVRDNMSNMVSEAMDGQGLSNGCVSDRGDEYVLDVRL